MDELIYKLDEKTHDEILKELRDNIFSDKTPVSNPKIVILGGQPGAGKSKIITLSENELFKDGNVVKINGDDYRIRHPKAEEIFKRHDKLFARLTDPDVREWTRKIFEEAMNKKFNIIFEGTLRTPQICETMKKLKQLGYETFLRVVAVNELISRTAIYSRYIEQFESEQKEIARFSEKKYHDEALSGMLKTIEIIEKEKLCNRIEIFTRDGKLLFSSEPDQSKSCIPAIIEERNKKWSLEEYKKFIEWTNKIIEKLKKYNLKEEYEGEIKELQSKAKQMLNEKDKALIEKEDKKVENIIKNATQKAKSNSQTVEGNTRKNGRC
jgi:UDP-N-acetylglucosamine kinase